MTGGPITTVAPSTTATALTSITTGLTPGEHGLIGYRIDFGGEVLNVLRWSHRPATAAGAIPPRDSSRSRRSSAHVVPVVSKAELEHSAFTEAHLRGVAARGWRATSAIAVEVGRQLAAGERFVYAYYDGVDKTAHERGFGELYDAELRAADRLVADVLDAAAAGRGAARHRRSRPGRRRRPHRRPRRRLLALVGAAVRRGALPLVARQAAAPPTTCWRRPPSATATSPGSSAATRSSTRAGSGRSSPAGGGPPRRRRPRRPAPISFHDPADTGPFQLVCRHGSLTAAEMLVPLLAGSG